MTASSPARLSAPSRAGAATTIAVAGLTAAVVEMVFVLPIQAGMGHSPLLIFQSIAQGALGRAAYAGGLASAGLGVAVHLLVSFVAAAVYLWAVEREPALEDHPVAGGMIFGALVYPVMVIGVIPLSRIGFNPPPSAPLWALSFTIHVAAFGLPISLAIAWMRHGRIWPKT